MAALTRYQAGTVTLLADARVAGGVTFAFTERTGGVSEAPYASLNLGALCGDDPACVAENRRRALAAVGAEAWAARLVSPHQVHGDAVVRVESGSPEVVAAAQVAAEAGADAVVCTVPEVPVLLCFADCVPVVLTCAGGFAVAHSGWRGTIARIAGKAARELADAADADVSDVSAYVGPHIGYEDYEVSPELAERFRAEFGAAAAPDGRHLDLGFCVRAALTGAGVVGEKIAEADVSTASATERLFSYRAEGGRCGRHAAVAVMGSSTPAELGWVRVDGEGRGI